MTSVFEPFVILLHVSHSLHGSETGPRSQFNAFAKIFAALVLPVPRGPLKTNTHALFYYKGEHFEGFVSHVLDPTFLRMIAVGKHDKKLDTPTDFSPYSVILNSPLIIP